MVEGQSWRCWSQQAAGEQGLVDRRAVSYQGTARRSFDLQAFDDIESTPDRQEARAKTSG